MFMKKLLLALFCLGVVYTSDAQMTQGVVTTTTHGNINFLYYTPPNYRSTGTGHPLIISLGGVGEQGDGSSNPNNGISNLYIGGIPKKIKDGEDMVFTYNTTTDGFVVIAPQLPQNGNWQNYYVDEMMNYAVTHFNIDQNRIFLTGYSLGGIGTWEYGSSPNINKLAGIIPISAGYPADQAFCSIAGAKVAVWAFMGEKDFTFNNDPYVANEITNTINQCSNLIIPAYDSTYPNEVHGADFWDNTVYSPTNNKHYPNVFQWMLMINRNIPIAGNQVPVASAKMGGTNNYTVTTPFKLSDLPLLDGSGSTDADDIIVDYLWEQLSGPALVNFSTSTTHTYTSQWPTSPIYSDNFGFSLQPGTYTFRLRVKDYLTLLPGHTQTANVTLNVNLPGATSAPAVNAGGARSISVDNDKQQGDAYFYNCTNCNAQSYNWTIVSFPAGASPQLKDFNNINNAYIPGSTQAGFANLTVAGDYKFRYSVANRAGDVGSDILTITRLSSALPVNYAYFKGENAGSKNTLTWATTSEINSDRFDIQRSTDGTSFSNVGTVASKGGAILTEYSFDDNNAPFGISYYRLSQVDKDGKTTLSKTISVNNRKTGVYIEQYPNPVHDNLTVNVQSVVTGKIKMIVADMQGKTIIQQEWQKDQPSLKKIVSVGSLQNGVYQMIISIGQEKTVSSFVKY